MQPSTHARVKQRAHGKLLYLTGGSTCCSVMTRMGGMGAGVREAREGWETCIYVVMTDSCGCTVETNTCYKAVILLFKKSKLRNVAE